MFYILDRVKRVICFSMNHDLIEGLAIRIALAGAIVFVATDGNEKGVPRLSKEDAFNLECPEGLHIDPTSLEKIVGPMGPDGIIPHG